jgi:hypothetical protein
MKRKRSILIGMPALALLAGVLGAGCNVNVSEALDDGTQTLTCDEFTSSSKIDADLDANVKVFLEATAELKTVSAELRSATKESCARIALDLGAEDTWSGKRDDNEATRIACDSATAKVRAIIAAHAQANFALVVTKGYCRQDFEQIKECDQICKEEKTCDSGSVETRCEPGQLSVVCDGKCKLSAHCEGSAQVAANCMGQCESTCVGECHGTCVKADGSKTENDPNCNGKCSAACNGKCKGLCKVEADAGIECGANVRCKGECEGKWTEPVCETKCIPPKCTVDTHCYDSCTTRVEAKTVCEPTRVELFCDGKVSVEVQKLQATINANLGPLLDVAEVRGKRVLVAANKLSATGEVVAKATGKMTVKSHACAAAGAKEAVAAATRIKVGVEGSASVAQACDGSRPE